MNRLIVVLLLLLSPSLYAQFTNRYPKVQGYRHHIYLEGFDFPFYSNGPVSPVASPDGKSIAFSAFGWLWIYDKEMSKATRVTQGGDMDFLPTWSSDGNKVAFVRDTRRETMIMVYDRNSKQEALLVDHPNASELDPYFSKNGKYLYYSSSAVGTFDIWRVTLETLTKERIVQTDDAQEFRPVPSDVDGSLYFISKAGSVDRINNYDPVTQQTRVVEEGRILSQLWFDFEPVGKQLVFNWPTAATWELFIGNAERPGARMKLYSGDNYVIDPSWNHANNSVLFSLAGDDHVFNMYEASAKGGGAIKLPIKTWDWGAELKTINVSIKQGERVTPARVVVSDAQGHFMIPQGAIARFDSQQGEVYFYTEGDFAIQLTGDKVKVKASHGLLDKYETDFIPLTSGVTQTNLSLPQLWNSPGWFAGEHHFHLNYGGPTKLQPQDLVPILKAEALDFATPMSANQHFLLKDEEMMKWEKTDLPKIRFGQEVRSHFHGHIGVFGNNALFWPWFWGPVAYETYTYDDRPNSEVLDFARKTGSIGVYVHPITDQNPMANEESMLRIPLGLVADAVNGNLDALEMACLWSDEIGSSVIYHHLINLGIPVVLSAGTDAFPGFGRSMAVGSSRIYVKSKKTDWESYLTGLRQGNSFVTTGPMIDLRINEKTPGQVIEAKGSATWELELATANDVDHIELLCNGVVIWESREKLNGSNKYTGIVKIPKGGWLAARVYGAVSKWPLMDSYPFAHTSPIWIGEVGSLDPVARKKSAQLLLKVLELSWKRINAAYEGKPIPKQAAQFQKAREKLEAWSK